MGTVLVTELVILALIAVPLGLLVGAGFATGILRQVNTETVRLPLVLTASNFAFAAMVVTIASTISALGRPPQTQPIGFGRNPQGPRIMPITFNQ